MVTQTRQRRNGYYRPRRTEETLLSLSLMALWRAMQIHTTSSTEVIMYSDLPGAAWAGRQHKWRRYWKRIDRRLQSSPFFDI